MPASLVELLTQAMTGSRAPVRFTEATGATTATTWGAIHAAATARAAGLQALGVGPGDRVAVLSLTSQSMVEVVLGVLLRGATLTVLPLPMRLGSVEAFVQATRARIRAARAALLVVDPLLGEQYERAPHDPPVVGLDDTLGVAAGSAVHPVAADDLAVLQFTSGSTASPRAVRLHQGALAANVGAIREGLALTEADRLVTWLPLYHDMGLIGGVFCPAAAGVAVDYATPQGFMADPAMWMRTVHERRASVIVAPNFAYALAARALRRAEALDLSSVRVAMCGAEPIDADTIDTFCAEAGRFGFDAAAFMGVYGLAEATLAVSFPRLGTPRRVDRVDREMLERDGVAAPAGPRRPARSFVGVGRPLAGVAVGVIDPTGAECAERRVGEVVVSGMSVMQGYDGAPDDTAAAIRDGWLHTGDLGYVADGVLFVCGRAKDVIIVGGRNIFPEDVEVAAASVGGVRAGNAVAFGLDGGGRGAREALVCVCETRAAAEAAGAIAQDVAEAVRTSVGLAPRQVVMLAPGALPKTSSGKLQRGLCRERYLSGELSVLASASAGRPRRIGATTATTSAESTS